MTREKVQHYLNEGYDILKDRDPAVVPGDLWDFLDKLDENDRSVLVLEDMLKWSDEELASLEF